MAIVALRFDKDQTAQSYPWGGFVFLSRAGKPVPIARHAASTVSVVVSCSIIDVWPRRSANRCRAGSAKAKKRLGLINSGLGCGDTQSPIPTFADGGHMKWRVDPEAKQHDNLGAQRSHSIPNLSASDPSIEIDQA
jgi:hypothetical protein